MKTQLTQLSLLETQEIAGGTNEQSGLINAHVNPFQWPGNARISNGLPLEYISLALYENGGKTIFIF